MKIQVLLLAATLFTVSASAQTKKIAHKSHSGSDHEFDLSGEDNFGIYIKPDTSRHLIVKPAPSTPPSDTAKPTNGTKSHSSSKTTKKKSTVKKKAK